MERKEGGWKKEEENKVAWIINNSIWSRAFVEPALTTVIALLPSFLDIVSTLLSPFPDRASRRLCLRIFPLVMPLELLYTFVRAITPPTAV